MPCAFLEAYKRLIRGRKRSIFLAITNPQGWTASKPTKAIVPPDKTNQKRVPEHIQPPTLSHRRLQIWRRQGGIPPHQRRRAQPDVLGNPRHYGDLSASFHPQSPRRHGGILREPRPERESRPAKKRVTSLVGGTCLHDRRKARAVSVAYEGRAVRGGDKAQGGKPLMGEKARMRSRRARGSAGETPALPEAQTAPASPRLGKAPKILILKSVFRERLGGLRRVFHSSLLSKNRPFAIFSPPPALRFVGARRIISPFFSPRASAWALDEEREDTIGNGS